jgi:hypothetical protein
MPGRMTCFKKISIQSSAYERILLLGYLYLTFKRQTRLFKGYQELVKYVPSIDETLTEGTCEDVAMFYKNVCYRSSQMPISPVSVRLARVPTWPVATMPQA